MLGAEVPKDALPTLQGKSRKGRKVVIKYFDRPTDLDLKTCRILFLSLSDPAHLRQIVKVLKEQPVLTVGDMEHFAHIGGMINFITRQNQTHFAIHVEAAQNACLRMRSKLLKLATIVKAQP